MSLDVAESPYAMEEIAAGVIVNDHVYDKVEIREITGTEEDYLAEKQTSVSHKMTKVLASCIKSLVSTENGSEPIIEPTKIRKQVESMAVGDRLLLFIRLRVISLGENFIMEFTSSKGNKFNGAIDLNQLEIKRLPDKKVRTATFKTPMNNEAVIRLLTGKDEEFLGKLEGSATRATSSMLLRVATFNGKVPTLLDFQKLSLRERNFIRDKMAEFDAGVDTTVGAIDPDTGKEIEAELGIEQKNFFFPSEI